MTTVKALLGVNTGAHIDLRVFRQKLSSLIICRSICVKGRKELRMKAAAVIHMLSLRNFKTESYTRRLTVGGLVAVSRHLAVVLREGGGGVSIYIYIHTHVHMLICLSIHPSIYPSTCLSVHLSIYLSIRLSIYLLSVYLSILISIHLSIYVYVFI